MTESHVLEQIRRDTLFYDQSHGGVTFSGGEPLAQPEFLYRLLKVCKEHEIHTAVDTSGYAPQEYFQEIVNCTDLFLYDIKVASDEVHVRETGVSNRIILQNLKLLPPDKVIVRVPLIPGVNSSTEHLSELAKLISSYRVSQVTLLPYHRGGVEKAKRLFATESSVYTAPSPDIIQNALAILEDHGLNPQIGG